MHGKAISLRVGNTQHLIPKIIMFPHRTPVLRTLCTRYRVSSIEGCFGLGLHEFPQAANWCSIHRAEFPPITIEDMMNYFVKTKNLNSNAFGLFKHGHVPIIVVATSEIGDLIRCECLLEIKTNLKYKSPSW